MRHKSLHQFRNLQSAFRILYTAFSLLFLLSLGFTRTAQAADYTFTTIDPPGSLESVVRGINDSGQIVGVYWVGNTQHGFLRNPDGGYITIDPHPASLSSGAGGINDAGQIVGWWYGDGMGGHLFLRNPDGGYVTIDPPDSEDSRPTDINDAGQILGCYLVGGRGVHYFLRNPDGGYITIDPPGSFHSEARGINDAGQIVGVYWDGAGFHGFLRNPDGGYITIDFPDSLGSEAWGINNSGQIVGEYRDGTTERGFLRNPDGGYITIDPPGSFHSEAWGINDAGQIVGVYWDNTGVVVHGFLADPQLKLFVVIPGINDHGEMMLEGAKKMVRYDDESKVFIMEKLRPSITAVQKAVTNASKKAKEKGKDVVVLIDMDLENYTFEFPLPPALNRWKRSVKWAGKMANIVSEAFSKEAPGGKRILYAHSAGGDATFQSVYQSRGKRMYDDINIFNGRTSAINLKNVLKSRGYGWRQVKVFTNRGDCPANPFWALANYDVVKQYAGASWVHLHCCDIMTCPDPLPPPPLDFCICHSVLRDSIPDGIEGTFEVNLSPKTGTPDCTVPATVKELMTRDWR